MAVTTLAVPLLSPPLRNCRTAKKTAIAPVAVVIMVLQKSWTVLRDVLNEFARSSLRIESSDQVSSEASVEVLEEGDETCRTTLIMSSPTLGAIVTSRVK